MTLAFGAPWALAALAALAVPLLLHLQRRRTPRILPFAALRWLGGARPARRTLRLAEAGLLALRLALVAVVVLWLAAPRLEGGEAAPRDVLLVVPGAAGADGARLPAQEAYWLAPGFPPLGMAPRTAGPTASLLREFDASLAPRDRLAVLVPRDLDGLDAVAIELGRAVDWRIVDGASPAPPSAPPVARRLAVRHASPDDPALGFVRAALAAWDAARPGQVEVDVAPAGTPLPPALDAVLWLGDEPDAATLAMVRAGATLLQVPATSDATSASPRDVAIGEPRREGRGWRRSAEGPWHAGIQPRLFDPDFPAALHDGLFGGEAAPSRAFAEAVAPSTASATPGPPLSLQPFLAWLIAALFLIERVWANGARLGRVA